MAGGTPGDRGGAEERNRQGMVVGDGRDGKRMSRRRDDRPQMRQDILVEWKSWDAAEEQGRAKDGRGQEGDWPRPDGEYDQVGRQ